MSNSSNNIHHPGSNADLGTFENSLGQTKPRAKRLQFEEEDRAAVGGEGNPVAGAGVARGVDDDEESDDSCFMVEIGPGTLTNILNELGTSGLQVEEILSLDYDNIQKIKPIHGFIFSFKWQEPDTSIGNLVEDNRLDEIFFVRQVLPNTCATQALVSILLNSTDKDLQLGQILSEYTHTSKNYDAEMRGINLSLNGRIRDINNLFQSQQLPGFGLSYKRKGKDTFHCVAYIPFEGHLYELDGLYMAPIEHGVIPVWNLYYVIQEHINL